VNVLFAADDLYPGFGGIAASTHGHALGLLARGHRIVALAGPEPTPQRPPDGVELVRLPAVRLGGLQTQLVVAGLRRVQRALRWADVVHVNAPTPFGVALVGMARARGVPTVMGVHVQTETTTHQLPAGTAVLGRVLLGRAMRTWFAVAFARADARVAPTAFAARMAAGWTGKPVHVVTNGLAPGPRPAPRDEARAQLPASWRTDGGGELLVYLGRLSAEKRPGDLLDLMHELPPSARLIVAGKGPLAPELERRIRDERLSDRVVLAGFVPDATVPTLLAAADLALMPSPAELQSIASLQAMAAGCPVAAADHASSAVPDWVPASGGGLVYPHDDPAEAGRRITAALRDPARLASMREAALRYASGHTLDDAARELERIYRALLRGETPSGALRPERR